MACTQLTLRCAFPSVLYATLARGWLAASRDVRDGEPEATAYGVIQSAHLAGALVSPHGLIGTAEVEFSGLPSITLSV